MPKRESCVVANRRLQTYHGPRWTAKRGGVEVRETKAIAGEFVDIWGSDFSSKTAYVGESEVIGEDDEEIGPFGSHLASTRDGQLSWAVEYGTLYVNAARRILQSGAKMPVSGIRRQS